MGSCLQYYKDSLDLPMVSSASSSPIFLAVLTTFLRVTLYQLCPFRLHTVQIQHNASHRRASGFSDPLCLCSRHAPRQC